MIKKNILILFTSVILLFSILILKNNVYGYQLQYRGVYNPNSQNLYFLSMGNAYGRPSGWRKFEDIDDYIDLTKQGVYQSYKFVLQSDISSKYGSNGYEFNYLKSKRITAVENLDLFRFDDYYQQNKEKINGKQQVSTQEIYRGVENVGRNVVSLYDSGTMKIQKGFYSNNHITKNTGFNLAQKAVINSTVNDILISKWELSSSKLKDMINTNSSMYLKQNEGGKYVYYSLPCILHNANTNNADYNYVALDTAYDAIVGFHSNKYDASNSGYDFGGYSINNHITTRNGLNSIINLYDNMLYIPSELTEPQEIYVRHVECDKDGKVIKTNGSFTLLDDIKNDSQIQMYDYNDNSWKEKIINNMMFKVKDKNNIKNNYQEYYNIPVDNQLKVSRSLILVNSGITYQYKGYSVSTAKTLEDAEKNLKNSSNIGKENNTTYTVQKSEDKQVTVIEFRYYKNPIDYNVPSGGVTSVESSDVNESCQMAYTPTGEDIIPYLVTNAFIINNLTYKYEEKDDKVIYQIKNFDVKKLQSGTISNNDKVDEKYHNEYKYDVGKIFGDVSDKWSLLVGDESAKFELSERAIDDINDTLNKFKVDYSNILPTQSELDTFINSNKTKKDDFISRFTIPKDRYNGIRIPKLSANYESMPSIDVNNTMYVLVYNPVKLNPPKLESDGIVDHTEKGTGSNVIQKNADFKLSINKSTDTVFNGKHTYDEYLDKYYLIFDFDIVVTDDSQFSGLFNVDMSTSSKDGDVIRKGTIIQLNSNITEFKAKAGGNIDETNVKQDINRVTLIGVSNNMPNEELLKFIFGQEYNNTFEGKSESRYISTTTNTKVKINNEIIDIKRNYCDSNYNYKELELHSDFYKNETHMYNDAYYFVKAVIETKSVGRIYDFKITDCSDIDFKNVFRKSNSNVVNELTGIEYFSGINKFDLFSNLNNTLSLRGSEIVINDTSAKTILPLGPYKNTNPLYISAPKMGYRISYNLKTSGYFDYENSENKSGRKIKITPSYYYISKDGKDYEDNITLYYKNAEGKYINLENSKYTIYFKPNDGYRFKSNENITVKTDTMSTQLEPLEISNKDGFYLNYKMMNSSGNYFIQSWYGEFKLPNSTIAIGGKKSSISNPLKDGYIGVKFDISCIDKKDVIKYNVNNHNVKDEKTNQIKPNTSQWDYEGYIGFNNPGSAAGNISIQLEKGTWIVNDNNEDKRTSKASYNDIKGTVVLFDLDNRAANDFE